MTGSVAVVAGALAAAIGSWAGDVNLRSGVVPWAFAVLVGGVGLILFGSQRGGIGRPAYLVRWASAIVLVGLGFAAAFFVGTGLLESSGSDLLSTGDTLLSRLGTLAASLCTLLVLPIGLVALSLAVLVDRGLPTGVRCLPLVGTIVFLTGPLLVAVLPDSRERAVLVAWPVLLGAVWAGYGLGITTTLSRRS